MPERSTTERLVRLVESGKAQSQACAARALGVSRERVRQIVNEQGLTIKRFYQPNTLISWPCPGCGRTVEMWSARRNNRKTAYCQSCKRRCFDAPAPTRPLCSVGSCQRQVVAGGRCAGHNMRWKQGRPLDKTPLLARAQVGHCSTADCPNQHYAKGVCRLHYYRIGGHPHA